MPQFKSVIKMIKMNIKIMILIIIKVTMKLLFLHTCPPYDLLMMIFFRISSRYASSQTIMYTTLLLIFCCRTTLLLSKWCALKILLLPLFSNKNMILYGRAQLTQLLFLTPTLSKSIYSILQYLILSYLISSCLIFPYPLLILFYPTLSYLILSYLKLLNCHALSN